MNYMHAIDWLSERSQFNNNDNNNAVQHSKYVGGLLCLFDWLYVFIRLLSSESILYSTHNKVCIICFVLLHSYRHVFFLSSWIWLCHIVECYYVICAFLPNVAVKNLKSVQSLFAICVCKLCTRLLAQKIPWNSI